jgi:post-segregation antitoxin (ccd killing protein)
MARRNISLPSDLDDEARRAGLNVSAIAQRAIAQELDRRRRMAALEEWLDELDAEHGAPSAAAMAEAEAWVAGARPAVLPPKKPAPSRTRRTAQRATGRASR